MRPIAPLVLTPELLEEGAEPEAEVDRSAGRVEVTTADVADGVKEAVPTSTVMYVAWSCAMS